MKHQLSDIGPVVAVRAATPARAALVSHKPSQTSTYLFKDYILYGQIIYIYIHFFIFISSFKNR